MKFATGCVAWLKIWAIVATTICLGFLTPIEDAAACQDTYPISIDEARAVWNAPQRRNLDSYFPFALPADAQAWQQRRGELRRNLLVSQGLWPLPPRTPLNPVIHGTQTFDDYLIEKVFFESMPGFWVTGSLYRPKVGEGPFPGVLCPHGHFRDGRFNAAQDNEIQAELAAGAELLEPNARSILQARCVHLARMGCVVFHYDMIGYADSQQIPASISHGFAQRRPHLEIDDAWGFYSPQAELRLQSIMGLQTWNSLRALDFLESLPQVDGTRLGVTGASGGGTQTFILGALDDRVDVAFPAVMVSTAMQGGCTCENACCLRTHTGNVEFAAMFAPRPLGLTAANDWTKEMASKGFPELQALYHLLGNPDGVKLFPRLEFGHNYNHHSRRAMYEWFAQHLPLASTDFAERPFEFLTRERLTVFDSEHPAPPGGEQFEIDLLRAWSRETELALGLAPEQTAPLDEPQRALLQQGWQTVLGHKTVPARIPTEITTIPQTGAKFEFDWEMQSSQPVRQRVMGLRASDDCRRWLVITTSASESAAVVDAWLQPDRQQDWNLLVVVLSPGELSADGSQYIGNPLVNNGRRAAAYTFGYNRPLVARQTSNLLGLFDWLKSQEAPLGPADEIALFGQTPGGEVWLAAALAPEGQVDRVIVNAGSFRFAGIKEFEDSQFLPGAVRYGDREALLGLAPASKILVLNSGMAEWPLASRITGQKQREWEFRDNPSSDTEQTVSDVLDWLKK